MRNDGAQQRIVAYNVTSMAAATCGNASLQRNLHGSRGNNQRQLIAAIATTPYVMAATNLLITAANHLGASHLATITAYLAHGVASAFS